VRTRGRPRFARCRNPVRGHSRPMEHLIDEFTGGREYLNAPAATIRDVHEAVGGEPSRRAPVARTAEPRRGPSAAAVAPCVGTPASSALAFRCGRIVHRHAAERAPHPLEGTGAASKTMIRLLPYRPPRTVRSSSRKRIRRPAPRGSSCPRWSSSHRAYRSA